MARRPAWGCNRGVAPDPEAQNPLGQFTCNLRSSVLAVVLRMQRTQHPRNDQPPLACQEDFAEGQACRIGGFTIFFCATKSILTVFGSCLFTSSLFVYGIDLHVCDNLSRDCLVVHVFLIRVVQKNHTFLAKVQQPRARCRSLKSRTSTLRRATQIRTASGERYSGQSPVEVKDSRE